MMAHSAPGQRHHGNRHGRSESARIAVLEAVDDLLVERGLAGVTIEGIAASAGVAKQTIYRRWDSITDILLDALAEDASAFFTSPDTGDLRADLQARLRELAAFLTKPDTRAMFRALAGQAQHNPAITARFDAEFMTPQRDLDRQPFLRAIQRGALPPEADIELATDQLAGPVYYRVLLTGRTVTPEYTDEIVDRFMKGATSDAVLMTQAATAAHWPESGADER